MKYLLIASLIFMFEHTSFAQDDEISADPDVSEATQEAPPKAMKKKRKKKKKKMSNSRVGVYGVAGCGLGSVFFGPQPGFIQVIAATTNGTSGNQTFGISSGTSNCDVPSMGHRVAVYIEQNKETVKTEAARGKGDSLLGLAELMGCESMIPLSITLKDHHSYIFNHSDNSIETVRRLIEQMKQNSDTARSCQVTST